MNDPQWIEHQMASWKPRGPSRKLEQGLFPAAGEPLGSPASPAPSGTLAWGWTGGRPYLGHAGVLAAGCFLLMGLLVWHVGLHDRGLQPSESGAAAFAALSNQSFTAYLTLDRSRRNSWRNPLEGPILGWTNEGFLPSSSGLLEHLNTNVLLPRL